MKQEAMPIVSAVLTEEDWNDFQEWFKRHPKKAVMDQSTAMGMYVQQRNACRGRLLCKPNQRIAA